MTLSEARDHIGHDVVYKPMGQQRREQGTITSVNDRWVFVRYQHGNGAQATDPGQLTLLAVIA